MASSAFGAGQSRPLAGVPALAAEAGLGEGIAGRGAFGLADFARLPCEAGRGQSMFGVTGLAFIPGEAGSWTEDLGRGAWAPERRAVPDDRNSVNAPAAFGDSVLSASMSAFTGSGDGIWIWLVLGFKYLLQLCQSYNFLTYIF